ncbi:NADH-quinone oxidoreductase subunit NuoG [Colwelliaceae bacterium 6441]
MNNKQDVNNQQETENNTVTVYIDDQAYQVSTQDNLLAGVLSQKLNLPYFCWHPSMGSVGACRQCAVTQYQDENDESGRIVMACTTPVTDGMRISLKDSQSEQFREQIIAAMMTNHPHDCPVCAEGGECHLQDMTVMTGHSTRAYKGDKRTFNNQYLGEFIGHEMNRCITCYRCVRYYKDYAGGTDFGVYGSSNKIYFGRQQDGQLASEFSGNLVEVCPTGVFTNKLFSLHYTRKWDLQSAPSICSLCSVGCHTSVGERYGSVRRVMNRYNPEGNGYFLCDKGRFGLGFVNGLSRIRQTKGIKQQSPEKLTRLDVSKALVHFRGKRFIGIGSTRASFEANYYLKSLVGDNHFCLGFNQKEMVFANLHQGYISQYPAPSIKEIEQADFVLIIDEDVTQTAPRIALAIRQALRNKSIDKASLIGIPSWQDSAVRTIGGKALSPLYILQSRASKLDDVAEQVLFQKSQGTIELVKLFTLLITRHKEFAKIDDENSTLLNQLIQAKNPLIVGGCSSQSPALFQAIIEFIEAINLMGKTVNALMIPEQANSMGQLALMDEHSLSVEQVLDAVALPISEKPQHEAPPTQWENRHVDGLIILENELSQFTEHQLLRLKNSSLTIICLDHSENDITQLADIVLPAATITESDGHLINYQGQIQRFYQVHPSILPIQESWRWLSLIAKAIFSKHPLAEEASSLAELHQMFRKVDKYWPIDEDNKAQKTARETHRSSGRTAKMANINVHESKVTQASDEFSFSMEGSDLHHTKDMPFTWSPGWNSNQSINHFQQEISGELLHQPHKQFIDYQLLKNSTPLLEVRQDQESVLHVQVPWYRSEWQSRLNPEFTLLHKTNVIYLSFEEMTKRALKAGQWLVVNLTVEQTGELLSTVALLNEDPHLSKDLIYGDINGVANQIYSHIELAAATQEQVKVYLQQFHQNKEEANNLKDKVLQRLKVQDSHIPIRLVSGGLDDA